MNSLRTAIRLAVAGTIYALGVTASYAAEINVNITAVHVNMPSESEKLSDGRTRMHGHDKAIVVDADPNSPLNMATRDCFGTMIMDAKGNLVDGAGYCETFDKSNDGYWLTWNMAPGGGVKWKAYYGTGKFAGVSGSGDTMVTAWYPDRYVIKSTGTLTLK